MAKKTEPKGCRETVKGLQKVITANHNAVVSAAKQMSKALKGSGNPNAFVLIPGHNTLKAPNFKKRQPTRSRE
jgi:hypothetical protein